MLCLWHQGRGKINQFDSSIPLFNSSIHQSSINPVDHPSSRPSIRQFQHPSVCQLVSHPKSATRNSATYDLQDFKFGSPSEVIEALRLANAKSQCLLVETIPHERNIILAWDISSQPLLWLLSLKFTQLQNAL